MNEKTQNILIVIVFIGLAVVCKSLYKDETYEEEVEKLNIKSVVLRKFINYSNHGIPYVVYGNDSIIVYRNWEDQIVVGDSIIKPEGSTKVIIKNTNKYVELITIVPGNSLFQ